MQIHEVTAGQIKAGAKKIGTGAWNAAKNAGSAVGSAVGDELERLAFGSTVTDYSQADPAKAKTAAQPKTQGPTADQYSAAEKIRKAKLAANAKAAQDQMAGKLPVANQPAAATPPAPVTPAPGAAAFGQMAQQLTTNPAATPAPKVNPAAAPVPYMFDGRKLNPNNANDARIIASLQAQGVTSATTAQVKKQSKQQGKRR